MVRWYTPMLTPVGDPDPYISSHFECVYSDLSAAWKIYRYTSTDPIASITAAGYVTDPITHGLGLGDLVYVTNPTTPTLYLCKVSAVSSTVATLSPIDILPPTPRTVTVSGTLALTDGTVLVNNNTGSDLALTAPASPTTAPQRILIVDIAGTAGLHKITWVGTLSGDTNPTLIDVNDAWAEVMWTGTAWIRIR